MATVAQTLRINGELASQLTARAPNLVIGVLVVLIGVRAAFLLEQLAGPPAPPAPTAAAPAPPPTRKVVDVPSILRANLFGESPPAEGSIDAPVTSMALVLAGVLAATDPKLGFALIGTTPADVRFYRVGGSVPGGAQLRAVYVDRVLLDRDGSVEALLMPLRAGTLPPPPLPPVIAGGAAQVGRVQQVMRENPGLLNQILSRSPAFDGNKLLGMKVYPGANKQAFDRLGLKSGDLVTAINGLQLNDRTRVEEVFNSLSNAAEAQITVTRNGAQQELHLNLAEIANEAERLAQQPPVPANPGQPPGPESAR